LGVFNHCRAANRVWSLMIETATTSGLKTSWQVRQRRAIPAPFNRQLTGILPALRTVVSKLGLSLTHGIDISNEKSHQRF
jgi:hypothetical protein